MRILVTGARGFIGSALLPRLRAAGHEPLILTRSGENQSADHITWNPETGLVPTLPGGAIDAVIHLAGENVGAGRWDQQKKARIRESRVKGVQILGQTIARLPQPPQTALVASAVGYYGDRGDEILTETSPPGRGFLAEVCQDVEREAAAAFPRETRTVILRFGVVLNGQSGALPLMARPFRMGLGGVLGSGRQFMPWIALDDAIGVIEKCLNAKEVVGPVIAASPNPARNRDFARSLGRALRRPVWATVPSFVLRLMAGEMADEMLLSSQRTEPAVLKSIEYDFRFPELESALQSMLQQMMKNPI